MTKTNEGRPDSPHPRTKFKKRTEPKKIDTVLLKQMRKDLESLRIDIETNYRRLYYGNPVVNHMLKMIVGLIEVIIEFSDFTEVDMEIEGLHKGSEVKSEQGFGISVEDI